MAPAKLELLAEEQVIEAAARHVSGAAEVAPAADQCVVVCLVRNGASYVDGFIEHYLRLGAAHIVFLDNGSSDGTPGRLAGRERVATFSCDLPYGVHKRAFKRWLIRRFGRGGWALCVDADEHFDYPGSERLPLSGLVRYLDERGFNTMPAFLLDMFPREPLAESFRAGDDWRRAHVFCDTASLQRVHVGGDVIVYGGVRGRLGVPRVNLTKHPLIRDDGKIRFLEENAHTVADARRADVSGVLLHYKFAPCFPARIADALEQQQYYKASTEYRAYDAVLRADPGLSLWSPQALRYQRAEDLIPSGWVQVSDEYRRWLATTDL